jgi:hypothetical protein
VNREIFGEGNCLRLVLTLLVTLLTNTVVFGQQDNRLFEVRYKLPDSLSDQSVSTARYGWAVHSFSFFRNLEWFNPIADGKTLFGQQLEGRFLYRIDSSLMVSGGVYGWKDFGSTGLKQFRPVYTLRYNRKWGGGVPYQFNFLFGTLEGNLAHRYIEPMLDFERVITNRQEEGMQFQLLSERFFGDLYVDWQQMIYPYKQQQERISGGIHVAYTAPITKQLEFEPVVQVKAYHQGGQLDTTAGKRPATTFLSSAIGARVHIGRGLNNSFLADAYYVSSTSATVDSLFPKSILNGTAFYANGQWRNPVLTIMLSYWNGEGVYIPQGGVIYQSLSSQVDNEPKRLVQKKRELLTLRLIKDFRLARGVQASFRAEPVLDLKTGETDYSFNFFINTLISKSYR